MESYCNINKEGLKSSCDGDLNEHDKIENQEDNKEEKEKNKMN